MVLSCQRLHPSSPLLYPAPSWKKNPYSYSKLCLCFGRFTLQQLQLAFKHATWSLEEIIDLFYFFNLRKPM